MTRIGNESSGSAKGGLLFAIHKHGWQEEFTVADPTKAPKAKFEVRRLEERIAPKILQVNGGGNVPNGNANGVPASNPAGHEPPGQNK